MTMHNLDNCTLLNGMQRERRTSHLIPLLPPPLLRMTRDGGRKKRREEKGDELQGSSLQPILLESVVYYRSPDSPDRVLLRLSLDLRV